MGDRAMCSIWAGSNLCPHIDLCGAAVTLLRCPVPRADPMLAVLQYSLCVWSEQPSASCMAHRAHMICTCTCAGCAALACKFGRWFKNAACVLVGLHRERRSRSDFH